MCEDIECEILEEDRCMTKTFCKQYAKSFPGYTCIDEICKGNDCVCKNIDELLCKDIGCEDQKECRCMIKEEYDKYMNESKEYLCTDEFCNGKKSYYIIIYIHIKGERERNNHPHYSCYYHQRETSSTHLSTSSPSFSTNPNPNPNHFCLRLHSILRLNMRL